MQPHRPARSTAIALFFAFAGYLLLTMAFTWPVAKAPASQVANDLGDPLLNVWILWWNAFHWPLSAAWWNAGIFFPADGALAFSEHLLGLSLFSTPIIWLSGSPLLGYNVVFLLTFALSATAAFLLVFELTGRYEAAVIGGLAFGFAPYRMTQLSHLQVLAAFWMPIALLGLHRFASRGDRRGLLVFLAAFVLQALTNGYYLFYFSVLVPLWVLWRIRRLGVARAAAIGAAALCAIGALLPLLLTYRDVHARYGLTRNLENMRLYSADVAGLISASPQLRIWGGLPAYGTPEGFLFTGVTVLILIVAGLAARNSTTSDRPALSSRSETLFYMVAAVMLFALALGPAPSAFGERLGISGPFAWLAQLPGFGALRVPARFGMLMTLCIAVGAAIGFARVAAAWRSSLRIAAAAVLSVAVTAEGWPRGIEVWDPPRPWDLTSADGTGGLLVLPILNAFNETASMYRAMEHGRPLANGYSGHMSPWHQAMREALDAFDPALLEELALAGVTQVAVVNRNDSGGGWRNYVRTRAALVRESTAGFTLFNLNPPSPRTAPGLPLPIAAVHASSQSGLAPALFDGRPETRWSTLSPQNGTEDLIVDLGSPRSVTGVEIELGGATFEYPRQLDVALSIDSRAWSPVWSGPTAGLAVGALMREPRRGNMVVSFAPALARFVRLRQMGRHQSAVLTLAELRVLEPVAPK